MTAEKPEGCWDDWFQGLADRIRNLQTEPPRERLRADFGWVESHSQTPSVRDLVDDWQRFDREW